MTARPRLTQRYGLVPDDAARLLALLAERAETAAVTGAVRVCRDPRDDMVIETAITGRAAALVSRDDDLKRSPEVAAALGERGVGSCPFRRSSTPSPRQRTKPPGPEPVAGRRWPRGLGRPPAGLAA